MGSYVNTPLHIKYSDIKLSENVSLSSQQYKGVSIKNTNVRCVSELLDRPLEKSDYGIEIGSGSYIEKSPYIFLKTGVLQDFSYLIRVESKSFEYMAGTQTNRDAISTLNLKKGDLLVSKDANVGEIVILDSDYPNALMSSGLHRLPVQENLKLYVMAFIKHKFIREQLNFLVPSGSTIRHGKDSILRCVIPFSNQNEDEVIEYVSVLLKAIIEKELKIKERYKDELNFIELELNNNQSAKRVDTPKLTLSRLRDNNRLDATFYNDSFNKSKSLFKNYAFGSETISDLGITFSRGQNLQISNIGNSIYSNTKQKGFYTLILPKNFLSEGVAKKREYLGNSNKLITLEKGTVIFGAEGTFRSIAVLDDVESLITNIHGIIMKSSNNSVVDLLYVKILLDYMRDKNMLSSFAVGGNGGSLAYEYWKEIRFPKFPQQKREILTNFFYTNTKYKPNTDNINAFIEYDKNFNEVAGIYDLDKAKQYLQDLLDLTLEKIINDEVVEIKY